LRHRLVEAASRIPDRALAHEYRSALLDRFFAGRRRGKPQQPTRTPRVPPSESAVATERGRILTAILLRHPGLLHDVEHAFAGVALPPACERLRKALLGWADHADVLDSQGLIDHLTASGLAADAAQVLAAVPVPLPKFASAEAMPGDAETGWWHIFGLTNRARLEEEVAVARRAFADCADEQAQRRLIALCAARDALVHAEPAEPGTPGPDRRI
jgi:DNA primase